MLPQWADDCRTSCVVRAISTLQAPSNWEVKLLPGWCVQALVTEGVLLCFCVSQYSRAVHSIMYARERIAPRHAPGYTRPLTFLPEPDDAELGKHYETLEVGSILVAHLPRRPATTLFKPVSPLEN